MHRATAFVPDVYREQTQNLCNNRIGTTQAREADLLLSRIIITLYY